MVAGGTPADLCKYEGDKLVLQFLGGSLEQVPRRFAEASPVTRMRRGDPPVFLYHGGLDTLVPVDHAEDYQQALQAAEVPNELLRLRCRGHIGAFLTDGAVIDAALMFLDRHFR